MKIPHKVWCNSRAAIACVKNPGNHKGTKHVDIRHLYSRDIFESKRIDVAYCPSKEMIADILTEAIPKH